MNTDQNPSVLFLAYTTSKAEKLFKEELKKKKINMRELKFYDVEIPMEKYDETINWFKEFVSNQCKRLIDGATNNFLAKGFLKKLQEKTGYSLMQPSWDWQAHNRHPLKFTLLFPLACEQKYINDCCSDEEKENYKKLLKFESKGYKCPSLKEQGIIDEKDMKIYKESKKDEII